MGWSNSNSWGGDGGWYKNAAASGGGTFTPASIPNIIGWYPAGTGSLASGGGAAGNGVNVVTQNDQSGAGNNLTLTNGGGPTINTSGLNGHTSFNFDSSSNKSLNTAANIVALPNSTTKFSCFTVLNVNTLMGTAEAQIGDYIGNGQQLPTHDANSAALLATVNGTAAFSAKRNFTVEAQIATTYGTNIQVGTTFDGATWRIYTSTGGSGYSLQATGPADTVAFTSLGTICFGGHTAINGGATPETGLVAEVGDIVFINDVISSGDMASLQSYWFGKYGV
jgi:hypothetical protein